MQTQCPPSGSQTWLAGKSPIYRWCSLWHAIYRWGISNCHVWLPEGSAPTLVHFCWQRLMIRKIQDVHLQWNPNYSIIPPVMGYNNMFISSHSPCIYIYIWYVYTPPIYMSLSNLFFFEQSLLRGPKTPPSGWGHQFDGLKSLFIIWKNIC